MVCVFLVFFFKQKTAYEMRISDWSSDVCSSDLGDRGNGASRLHHQSVDHLEGLGDRLTIEGSDDNVLELRPVQKASVIYLAEVRVAAGVRVPSPDEVWIVDVFEHPRRGHSEDARTDERRVGNERVSTCGPRWSRCT